MKDGLKENPAAVMLAIESGRNPATSIDLAIAIAASIQSRIHGRFIENDDLLRVASLPFTREISLTTGEERPTDFNMMQRSLQSMASAFKKSIKKAAMASQIPWSFDYITRTPGSDAGLEYINCSFTVLAQRVSTRAPAVKRTPTRRVLLVEDHSPNLIHALKVVLQQFGRDKVQLTRVGRQQVDEAESSELDDFLKHAESAISLIELRRDQLTQVLEQYAGCYNCAIVSSADARLREILDKMECPLILVSQ